MGGRRAALAAEVDSAVKKPQVFSMKTKGMSSCVVERNRENQNKVSKEVGNFY